MKGIKGFHLGHEVSLETRVKIGNANRKPIFFLCEQCGNVWHDKKSSFKKKNKHFCSMTCYKTFVKDSPYWEQNSYRGIRKIGQSKQIYHQRNCQSNPETIKHLKARRYARERGADGSHTLKEWQELKERYDYKCAICSQIKPLTKDHIIPLSHGGTDSIDNIQPLCRNCNSKKWKKIYKPELMEVKS